MQTLRMPQRSKSIQEVTVGSWNKAEGDQVKTGDIIAEAQAADALYELQAAGGGTLLKIIAPEGTVVPVNAPIALIGKKGEDIEAALGALKNEPAPATAAVKPAQAPDRVDTSAPLSHAPAQSVGGVSSAPQASAQAAPPPASAPAGVIPVLMPQPGQSVEECTIVTWRVKEGDRVNVGDVLCDLETDKATVEFEAPDAGRLSRILVQEDEIADVLTPIAYLSDEDAAVDAFLSGAAPAAPQASAPQSPPPGPPATVSAEPPAGVTVVLMPQPGQSVEECTIVTWRVKEGDQVNVGDVLCDLETDKATVEFEAPDAGRLSRIVVAEEQIADVLTPIAYLSDDDATVDAFLAGAAAAQGPAQTVAGGPSVAQVSARVAAPATTTATGRIKASPAARKLAAQRGVDIAAIGTGSGPGGRILSTDVAGAQAGTAASVQASPAARKLAAQRGVDIAAIGTGSGPGGRILSTDVAGAQAGASPKAKAKPAAPAAGGGLAAGPSPEGDPAVMGQPNRIKMSGMRKAIARNLQHSKQTIPHFYIKREIRAEALMAAYKKLKEAAEFKCTINDFVVAACAKAIAERPTFRQRIDGTDLLEYPNVNVGIAVGVENGLVVPVIQQADALAFRDLAGETRRIVEAARGGKAENMGQGVFTITNMGMFKIGEFLAIVNPPEAAILAVGAAADVPVVEDGKVVVGKVMNVILSVDHRIIDGVLAAEFVNRLKELLEAPEELLA